MKRLLIIDPAFPDPRYKAAATDNKTTALYFLRVAKVCPRVARLALSEWQQTGLPVHMRAANGETVVIG
jgi:hypothetical protein